MSKLVAVIGATGNQGSAVINSILNDPEAKSQFSLRGLTRAPQSSKAKALTAKGVECVAADINKKASLEAAFTGAYAVFAVTNFWETMSKKTEVQQGRNIADACKANGVKNLIWSTLVDVSKLSKGKYTHVDHFDGKAQIDDYATSIGVPTTFFMPGYYMNNLPGGMLRLDQTSNTYKMQWPISPDALIPVFEPAKDTGKFVKAILLGGDAMIGKRVYAADSYMKGSEIIDTFKKVFPNAGKGAEFEQVEAEGYKKGLEMGGMPPAVQDDLCQMLQFIGEFGYYGGEPLEGSLALLKEKTTTLEQFFRAEPSYKDLT